MGTRNYDYCKKCGHQAESHTTTRCNWVLLPTIKGEVCDCDGWEYGNTHRVGVWKYSYGNN